MSIGADGVALGYYRNKNQKKSKRFNDRKPSFPVTGEPYDMVFTGDLKKNLEVRITTTYMVFKSGNAHVAKIQHRDFWGTKNWFGLTESNMRQLVNHYLKKQAKETTLKKILTGEWI